MEVHYDPKWDVLNITLAEGDYCESDELDDQRHIHRAADGTVLSVEILSPRALGVDVTDLPQAAEIGAELRRLGFRVREPAHPAIELS